MAMEERVPPGGQAATAIAVAEAGPAPAPDALPASTWRWIRRLLLTAYVGGTYLLLLQWGRVPVDREVLVGWIVGLLVVNCAGRTARDALVVVASWAPFLVALYVYDFARSVGYRLHRPIAVTPQIAVDRFLGLGRLPTEILQEHLYDRFHIRWYDVAVSVVYVSHFFVPYAVAGYLWRQGQRAWRWYAGTFVGATFVSCAVYASWGTAPPWYAARQGLVDPFPRVIAFRGWGRVGLQFAAQIIEKGQKTVNPFAAIPSLHAAEALLAAVFLWTYVWRPLRVLLVAYPLAMCFTLVYAGEHYLVDVLAGWGCVAALLTVGWWVRQRRTLASPFRWRGPWAPAVAADAPAAAAAGASPPRRDPGPPDGGPGRTDASPMATRTPSARG